MGEWSLTGEEMQECWVDGDRPRVFGFWSPNKVAEAQAKKLVEWLRDRAVNLSLISSAASGIALSSEDWQALCKGVELPREVTDELET